MIFEHQSLKEQPGAFKIGDHIQAEANSALNKGIFKEFWNNFTYTYSTLEISDTDELSFSVGNVEKPNLDNLSYAIKVESNGIYVTAKSEKTLIQAFMTLLDLITLDNDGQAIIPYCEIKENPLIEKRMIHFCFFPETTLWQAERFIRLCGALKYSHIVFEIWGMYQYKCLKELAWQHAFTSEEIKPLVQLANDLGMEVIPMFNHWGHASQSRVMYGKHVVLNQNPKLQYLFSEDGWRWNIKNPTVKNLLHDIRRELIELCGNGEYFHIGCDEAYGFDYEKSEIDSLCEYINEVSADIISCGKRPIMWADMLLYQKDNFINKSLFTCAPNADTANYMMSLLSKDIITADWQYECTAAPVDTSLILKDAGFDVFLCPWDRSDSSAKACVETVDGQSLSGLMHTTWHTLSCGTPQIEKIARLCWRSGDKFDHCDSTKTAALLRKVYHTGNDYEKAGWAINQIEWI